MNDDLVDIPINLIDDPAHAMRAEVRDDSLWELADNIKHNGLINPITVRPVGERFEVVAGHRRFSACKINGMASLKCVVRELSDQEAFAVMAAENLERKDVDLLDEATFIAQYMANTGAGIKETAAALRRSIDYVEKRVIVGQMPDYMQAYLKQGVLKLGVALALYEIDNDRIRRLWTDDAVRNGISVALAQMQRDDYRVRKDVYDGAVEAANGGPVPNAPQEITFIDELDGKTYSIKTQRLVAISDANYPLWVEFVRLMREGAPPNALESGGGEQPTPAVAGAAAGETAEET